jgi:hypothetical protein
MKIHKILREKAQYNTELDRIEAEKCWRKTRPFIYAIFFVDASFLLVVAFLLIISL